MALSGLGSVVSYLRKVTPAGKGDDAHLLARFVAGDELAFAALVHRYAPLVWGVCRRTLSRTDDAEDAFQATFLVLFRKAPSLGGGPLGPWLHSVARRTANRAREQSARIAANEVAIGHEPAAQAVPHADWKPVLDQEIDRLPAKYRAAIVLCYLEGLTNEQAADRLGCPKGTILSRLSRGRDQLRERLQKRGVELPAVLPALSAPAALIETLVRAGPAAREGLLSATVLSLAEGVTLSMSLHKLKLFAMTVFTLAFLGGGAGLLASRPAKVGELHAATVPADDDNDEQAPDKPKEKVATPKTKDRAADKTPSERELRASLSKKVEYKGEEKADTTLGDVLDQLTKLHGIPFIIDTDAFKRDPTDERPGDVRKTVVVGEEQGPIPPMKTSLRNVLRIVLGRVNATYLIRQDYIEITTESAVRRELELPDRIDLSVGGGGGGLGVMGGGLGALGGGGGMLGGVGTGMFYHPPVPPLIHDEFTKEPLNTVVERIAESANVNIIIDIRVDKKAIAPVTGRFRNVPVETALELLGDQADLGVVKRGHVYYLTSAENAERMRKAKK